MSSPDLFVPIIVGGGSVSQGANFTFSYTVQNIGAAAALASAAAYDVDEIPDTGHFLGYNIINALPNAGAQVVAGGFSTAGLSLGQHTLWIAADNWGQVGESNEANNFTSVTFTVTAPPQPDLAVSFGAPASVVQGANLNFNYVIFNLGMAAAVASGAAYYVDQKPDTGHFLGYGITNPLAVGTSQILGGGFNTAGLSAGQHFLWIGADNWGQVAEGNETNNWTSVAFTVLAPDLVVNNITAAATVNLGANFTFNYTIQNIGTLFSGANAAAYYVDRIPDTGHFLGYGITNTLAAGASQTLGGGFSTAGLSAGQHFLWIGADNWNQVAEGNETNNWTSVTFTILAPDLVVSSITTAGSVGQGGDLTFNYTVQNIGNMTAGASTAAYRIDALPDISHFAGSNPTNALAAGGAQNLAGSVNTAGLSLGQHTLWVETDVANQVAESNENNNWTAVNFTVTAPQLKINLIYDSFAMAAPQSFRDGMQAAANILQAAFHDNITVNIVVGYGEYGNGALALPNQNTSEGNIGFTGGGQFGAGQGVTLSYANLRADLAADAKDGTDTQSVNSLPGGTSLQGHSSFVIGSAQAKALGLLAGNNGAVDGQVGMGTNFTGNVLIAGALHELTHAMGRIAGDSLDIFRYNAPGNHVFGGSVPQPASYFSIDGGSTKLADFGRTSDPGDFLNSGVQGSNDPFNESVGNLATLTSVDLTIMDVLGFDLTQGFHGSAAQIADASAPTSPAPSAGGLDTALLSQYMATIPASPGGGAMGIITPDLMQASNTNPLLAQPHA
jgi:subtilase family serine protease